MKTFFLLIFLSISSFVFTQNLPENSYLLAENYYREGEYEKALQLYKKLYVKSPFNTTYLDKLISCYQETEAFLEVENLVINRLKKNKKIIYSQGGYSTKKKIKS